MPKLTNAFDARSMRGILSRGHARYGVSNSPKPGNMKNVQKAAQARVKKMQKDERSEANQIMAIDYAALNALTNEWGAQKAQLDDSENRLRINYNGVLDRMKRDLGETNVKIAENSADRGMRHAGPTLQGEMDVQSAYSRAGGEAAQKQNLDLATIARKRLEADQAYNSQKLLMQLPLAEGIIMATLGPDGFASRPPPGTTRSPAPLPPPHGTSWFNNPAALQATLRTTGMRTAQPRVSAPIQNVINQQANPDPHDWAGIAARYAASQQSGGDSGGGGASSVAAPTPTAFVPPESISAPPAAVMPPAVVADAPSSSVNVPGESFTSVGTPGTFGQYDRQRQSRGPRSGLSVTPEMLRRAAQARMG